jgi:hypothetical protein
VRITLERVAHHEAGHALLAHLLGWKINWVTIVPDDDLLGAGACRSPCCLADIDVTEILSSGRPTPRQLELPL